jgi:hypothetical protein
MVALSEPETIIASKTANIDFNQSQSVESGLSFPNQFANQKDSEQYVKEAQDLGFSPVITDFGYSKESPTLQKMVGFNMRPFGSFYNVTRVGYNILQAITPAATALIAQLVFSCKETDDIPNEASNTVIHSQVPSAPVYTKSKLSKHPESINCFYSFEAALVTAVSMSMTCAEIVNKVKEFDLTLAAELGKDRDKINCLDFFQSKNPIVMIERDRMVCKTFTRLAGGASFVGGLTTGLIVSSIALGAERTVYYVDSPYDILSKAMNEVHYNHLSGDVAKENLVTAFQKAMQGMYGDRDRNIITEKEMQELKPVLLKVADDVVNKRIGVESIYGIIGGGIIVVGDPEKSANNYEFVSNNMMEAVVEVAKSKRLENSILSGNVVNFKRPWAYQLRDRGIEEHNPKLATSARPDYVEREKERMSEKQFQNYLIG